MLDSWQATNICPFTEYSTSKMLIFLHHHFSAKYIVFYCIKLYITFKQNQTCQISELSFFVLGVPFHGGISSPMLTYQSYLSRRGNLLPRGGMLNIIWESGRGTQAHVTQFLQYDPHCPGMDCSESRTFAIVLGHAVNFMKQLLLKPGIFQHSLCLIGKSIPDVSGRYIYAQKQMLLGFR